MSVKAPILNDELAHDSQHFNLDNEGTSQFTYPAAAPLSPQKMQKQSSYNPVSSIKYIFSFLIFICFQNNYQVKSPYYSQYTGYSQQ